MIAATLRYTCVNPGERLAELEFVEDHSREISYRTFRKAVDEDPRILSDLGKDPCTTFHKSRLPDGRPAHYFVHSAIVHVYYAGQETSPEPIEANP